MVEDVATIYGKDETPALYALTEGDMEAVSLPLLLTAWDQGDLALESLVKHYLDMLCCLLINVLQAYFAQKVYLHNFDSMSGIWNKSGSIWRLLQAKPKQTALL